MTEPVAHPAPNPCKHHYTLEVHVYNDYGSDTSPWLPKQVTTERQPLSTVPSLDTEYRLLSVGAKTLYIVLNVLQVCSRYRRGCGVGLQAPQRVLLPANGRELLLQDGKEPKTLLVVNRRVMLVPGCTCRSS